jgi:hypothetical protein
VRNFAIIHTAWSEYFTLGKTCVIHNTGWNCKTIHQFTMALYEKHEEPIGGKRKATRINPENHHLTFTRL